MKKVRRWLIMLWGGAILVGCGVNAAERNNAGNAMYDQGDYNSALQAYQSAQVAVPDQSVPYYNAASALVQLGELEAAQTTLEHALTIADEELTAQAYYNLGNVYFEMGLFAQAVEAYQETLLRRPDDQDARYNYELALNRVLPLTPTALEQQVEPEQGQTDPNTTPTPNPGGLDGPSPTPPPPQQGPPDPTKPAIEGGDETGEGEDTQTLTPQPEGTMSLEDAERLLDAVQQDQRTLQEYLHDPATPSDPSEEDW